ncbi:RNA polymerase sigma factor [Arthrobacter crusticola]|uniref:RNA polymerase sigma factor n=1 Tax=Arthrobacter crusticola TaxID=2547960 RepID=UPI001FE85BDE|nr:sigma factor [Arthrobacter crusticola]
MGENNPDDGGLWSRSLAGDGDAFGVLFDRHRDRVYRHAYRLAPNRADAEDVSAAAFLSCGACGRRSGWWSARCCRGCWSRQRTAH